MLYDPRLAVNSTVYTYKTVSPRLAYCSTVSEDRLDEVEVTHHGPRDDEANLKVERDTESDMEYQHEVKESAKARQREDRYT